MPLVNSLLSWGPFQPMDDAMRTAGRNGKPALAEQFQRFATSLNSIGHAGRPIFHWWGGGPHNADIAVGMYQTLWSHYFLGGRYLRGRALVLEPNNTRDATQGIRVEVGQPLISSPGTEYDYPIEYDLAGADTPVDPTDLIEHGFGGDMEPASNVLNELLIGSRGDTTPSNAPGLISGCMYEPQQLVGDPSSSYTYVPPDLAKAGHDIVAVATSGDLKTVDRVRAMLRHNFLYNRPHVSWSALNPGIGAAGTNWIAMDTASAAFRYIFDQTIGDSGTAPSATTPGITVPLYKSSAGLRGYMVIHLYVYAALSAASAQTGRIGVATKYNSFTFTEINNGPLINSTTWQWWPAATVVPGDVATSPYFLGDSSVAFERVLIGAKLSAVDGAKHVKIGAFAMVPQWVST